MAIESASTKVHIWWLDLELPSTNYVYFDNLSPVVEELLALDKNGRIYKTYFYYMLCVSFLPKKQRIIRKMYK